MSKKLREQHARMRGRLDRTHCPRARARYSAHLSALGAAIRNKVQ